MKTKNIHILILISVIVFSTSCEDKLDLSDPNNTGASIALETDKNVKSTLLGAYDALSAGAFYGGNSLRNSEIMAANGESVFSGTFNDVADIYRKEIVTSNADVANLWISAYNTINVVNNVLSALSVVNEDDREQVEGEALFIRGVSYFELVLFYGKPYSAGSTTTNLGVPLMLVEDRNSVVQKPRSTVAEVYAQIIEDLTTAEEQLASGPNPGKASSDAAAAILSRVYLQMGDYPNARDAANRVIAADNFALASTYAGAFAAGSTSEDIFDIPVSSVDGVNNMNTFFASSSNGGRGDIEVMNAHLSLYDPLDDRLDLFYTDNATAETRVGKWKERYGSVKIVRLAEMYLTRAEANFRVGGAPVGDTPLNDINYIRDRVNLPALASVTLATILLERKLELAFEGQRLHDVKRLQDNIILGAVTFPYNDNLLVFPIPQRERDVNSNLQQNAGYGN